MCFCPMNEEKVREILMKEVDFEWMIQAEYSGSDAFRIFKIGR
jgi:hypothetical protein